MPGSEVIHVDLSGPDGNAFALIGLAQKLAKQLHYQQEERSELTTEMMSTTLHRQTFLIDTNDSMGWKETLRP